MTDEAIRQDPPEAIGITEYGFDELVRRHEQAQAAVLDAVENDRDPALLHERKVRAREYRNERLRRQLLRDGPE